jgi:dsRNA-specific ribonuclease
MADAAQRGAGLDWKTSLQELTAATALGVPEYSVSEEGPDHEKHFTAIVRVAGEVLGSGVGRSKKQAEQMAAEAAWKILKERTEHG